MPLDYLIQIRGYGLVDAVHALVGGEIQQAPAYRSAAAKQEKKEPEKKTFSLPWARRCATAAVSYLQKRGISSELSASASGQGCSMRPGIMASRSVCLLGKTIQEKRSLPVCAVSPEALEKMCMAAIRNTASVSRRRIRAAAMWRSLRLPSTPSPTPRCRN